MTDTFQAFINLSWPWFIGGLFIRVFCWLIGGGMSWLSVALGFNDKD